MLKKMMCKKFQNNENLIQFVNDNESTVKPFQIIMDNNNYVLFYWELYD